MNYHKKPRFDHQLKKQLHGAEGYTIYGPYGFCTGAAREYYRVGTMVIQVLGGYGPQVVLFDVFGGRCGCGGFFLNFISVTEDESQN